MWWSGRLDTRHGQHDRDVDIDIEEAPVRWQCPEAGLEMPVVQTRLDAMRERLVVQTSYWVMHMTGVEMGIVRVTYPDRAARTLRASSHVTAAKSSETCTSTRGTNLKNSALLTASDIFRT
jgi:hypothetical protein